MSDVTQKRLDLAGTRSFAAAGAGQARRAALADFARTWLAQRWDEAAQGMPSAGLALAAVGSVARGDAGPLSDYDLVLLHDGRGLSQKDLDAFADRLWYPMWDSGTKIDHSVRTVAQCRQVAGADLSAAVGLLDLVHVAGDAALVSAARSSVAHDWRGNARKRLPEMIDAVTTRHTRMGDCAHLLEPDLKEARGGLRDMTVLRALTAAWLADRPHGEVDAAYGRLLDVRDAVHVVTGRARDRLTRDDHDSVAALMGYAETDRMLIDLSQAARVVAYALDGTLRRAAQAQRARILRVGPRRPSLEPLGYGLFRHDGEVVLGPGVHPHTDPTLALRAAGVAARAGMPLAPATLANLAAACPPLPDPWPTDALALFTDLLAAGPGLVGVWEGLDLVGIIETWIPQWRDVRSRPQHNAVHRHTVDRHSIEAVVIASSLVRGVQRPDLLLLAALLHDIGKVAVADEILGKNTPLSAEEEQQFREHTRFGKEFIQEMENEASTSSFLSLARNIAHSHHEHWDGSGYPEALRGAAIPLEARIVALADAYEEFTATSDPEKRLSHLQAVHRIIDGAGRQFDPLLVQAFSNTQHDFEKTTRALAEHE